MSAQDPTGGLGYGIRERLPSADMTTIATQQVRLLDVVDGGTYDVGGAVVLQDDGGDISVECPLSFDANTWPLVNSRTVVLAQPLGGAAANDSARWEFKSTGGHWWQSSIASIGGLVFPLTRLVNGATLTTVTFRFDGDLEGSSNSDFPATMPSVTVYKTSDATGFTSLGTHTMDATADFASTIGNYNGVWNYALDVTDTAILLNQQVNYYCAITGEASTNAVTGLTLLSVSCSFTVTELRY